MQKRELIQKLAKRSSQKFDNAEKFLSSLTTVISKDLKTEGKTLLSGLGTFRVKQRDAKITTNPQKPSEVLKIPERKAVTFTAGTTIKSIVRNKPPEEITANIEDVLGQINQETTKQDILNQNYSQTPVDSRTDKKKSETDENQKIDKAISDKQQSKASTIPYIDLSDKVIPKSILQKVPEYLAQLYKAVPVEEKDGKLLIAMIDPEDFQAINFIRKAVGSNIQIALTTQKDIEHILTQYSGLQSRVEKVISATEIEKQESKVEKTDKEAIEDDTPVAKIVNSVLNNAVGLGSSDIHIEPKEKEVVVRFRIDGVLQKNLTLPKKLQSSLVSRIKILCNMKIDEQRLPQDGRFRLGGERPVDFRVSSFPTVFGEKIVMRILDRSQGVLTMEQIGLTGKNLEILKNGIRKSHGMTLVTGPTGSGKTTTLYAVLQELMDVGVNIVTLEDPVEYQINQINQGQVRSDIGFTFASGLRSIVRQDPDIIMVGEIRDLETAELAVQSALTGHIVLSTLHTNDAAGAIPRLVNMGVEPFLITSSINTIVAQRLARKICMGCKEEEKISLEILEDIKKTISVFPPEEKNKYIRKPLKFYKGKGCEKCNNSGYKKRIGIFEILDVSEKVKSLALQKVSSSELEKQARIEGMISMKQDGIMKALNGITSIEEVWRVTKE